MTGTAPLLPSRQQLAALRLQGAHHLDPVRFHFLEALAERAQGQSGPVQQAVEEKLAQALAEWKARRAAENAAAEAAPSAAADASPAPSALRALTAYLAPPVPAGQDAVFLDDGHSVAAPELKSVRDFRATWSRLSADRQLTQALQQAPRNAGPINSHSVVLRSLALMRDTSPDYLSRFVSYVDTLLCLEPGERLPKASKPSRSKPRPSP